ncbi:hypothetical protein GX563_09135 [Candidatus Bathyarchaeota archaeon]|nr:hypothetical protein [Candidatus Bathyarchaeota archaeon]
MSASLNVESGWNFRTLEKRLVAVKSKAENVGKIAVQDVLTNLMFTVEVHKDVSAMPITELSAGKEYLLNLKVLTSKNLDDVKADAISFFQAVDIEQSMDDYIKAYWLYPSKIRFQLVEAEQPT